MSSNLSSKRKEVLQLISKLMSFGGDENVLDGLNQVYDQVSSMSSIELELIKTGLETKIMESQIRLRPLPPFVGNFNSLPPLH